LSERISKLLELAADCCQALGLSKNLLPNIYQAENDWEYVLKTDALLETTAKAVIKDHLKIERDGIPTGADKLDKFVDALPLNGRTSLMQLLRATGCDQDICDFIEATRWVRNAYAHDIRKVDASLLSVVQGRGDWQNILKKLSPIEKYDEKKWVEMIEENNELLRFAMFDYTIVFIALSYHISLKEKLPSSELADDAK
jgi:hypothetical protein